MADALMPCFSAGQYEKEGAIIGHLLVGYGELELEMTACVGNAIKSSDDALKAVFGVRGEARRIKLAKANLRLPSKSAKLEPRTAQVLADMEWCKEIRNQYAHCQWYPTNGLGFINLEEVALVIGPLGQLEKYRHDVHLPLLVSQEEFFGYVKKCFWHLAEQYQNWATQSSSNTFPMPQATARPPKYI